MNIRAAEDVRPLPPKLEIKLERERVAELLVANPEMTIESAQQQAAADHGFARWSDLVDYCTMTELHDRAGTSPFSLEEKRIDREVDDVMQRCNSRKLMTEPPPDGTGHLAAVATFVPRFYGASDAEITAETLTKSEAQLVVARLRRFMNWEALRDKVQAQAVHRAGGVDPERYKPFREADKAVQDRDCDALARLFRENPKWIGGAEPGLPLHGTEWSVIMANINSPSPESRAMFDLLVSIGVDMQSYLDEGLLGDQFRRVETSRIRGLLELGANPHWIPQNRCTVLEHAISRYMNGDAVDLIARYHTPRKAFWIAAGLGDVPTMLQFVDENCVPTEAARRDRPDTNAIGFMPQFARSPRPCASDREVVWEAFMVAALNGRYAAADALLDRGFPIDYSPVWYNALLIAAQNYLLPVVEYLLSRGADPHYKSWPDHHSPLYMAKFNMEHLADKPGVREVYALMTRS